MSRQLLNSGSRKSGIFLKKKEITAHSLTYPRKAPKTHNTTGVPLNILGETLFSQKKYSTLREGGVNWALRQLQAAGIQHLDDADY